MSRHGAHASLNKSAIAGLLVALVCAVAGFLFVLNVTTNGSSVISSDTEGLLHERAQNVTQLQEDIDSLSSEVDTLKKTLGDDYDPETTDPAAAETTSSVLPAYTGPGMTITLSDSPLWKDAQNNGDLTDTNVNDYVVHQQDLEAVINAMWAGGAEAMMIQDQRVLPTTAVRCVGNVLLLQGKQYAPPYKVTAIGPIDEMRKAVDKSDAIKIYKQYVDSIGLGWEVEVSNTLEFPETTAVLQTLKYASPIE